MANFRVIIVGGGIGGLTLANCLQHANIDFLLLEGREKIGLHFGIGVGVGPPAARILDQLGVYSDLEDQNAGTPPVRQTILRDSNGKTHHEAEGPKLTGLRTGYPVAFFKRYALLETLYKHIWDQEKVLVSKRVKTIEYENSRPTVICGDGSRYSGDIVVGCDGAYSAVRKEMWRICDRDEPGKIPSTDKEFLTAEYRGVYGYSNPVKGIETGAIQMVAGQDELFYWIVLKDGTIFWNFVEKLDKKYYLPNIPRYTDEDARAFVEGRLDKVLISDTDRITVRNFWEKTEKMALFAVEEGDLGIWTSGRIVCIGDSAHKVTPESAVGTMMVTESAASLANHLKRLVDSSGGKVTDSADIEICLKRFETHRRPRASRIVQKSYGNVRFLTFSTRMIRFIFKYVVPNSGESSEVNSMEIGAERIEFLPIPARNLPGTMAYNPTQGLGKNEPLKPRALFALPLLLLAVGSWRAKQNTSLVFELQYLSILLLWLIEGSRLANKMKLFQFTLIFGILSYFTGVILSANIWFFLHYTFSPIEIFAALDRRLIQMNYARALFPTIILGAIIPALTVTAYPDAEISKHLQSLWPILPIILTITHRLFATLVKNTTAYDRFYNMKADLSWLRIVIIPTAFTSFVIFHYLRINNKNLAYLSIEGLLSDKKDPQTLLHDLGGFMWLALLFKDLKKARMVEVSWAILLSYYLASNLLIGSGGTLLAAWMWREEILATKRHWAAVV